MIAFASLVLYSFSVLQLLCHLLTIFILLLLFPSSSFPWGVGVSEWLSTGVNSRHLDSLIIASPLSDMLLRPRNCKIQKYCLMYNIH